MYTDSDVAHRHVARVRYRNRVVKYFTDSAEGRQRNMPHGIFPKVLKVIVMRIM